jgi:hypothetical protein
MSGPAQLLFACATLAPSPARADRIREVCGGVDWEAVDSLARRHGLLALTFRTLSTLCPDVLPRPYYAAWWAASEALARGNAEVHQELGRLLHRLQADGIAATPYKGPTLALGAYGDVRLREFGDLDLLVAPSQVARARASLARLGYRSELRLSSAAEHALVTRSRHYEWPLRHETTGLLVELHWRADPEYRVVDLEQMALDGRAGSLPPSVLMLILCLHGTKHFWSSAAWLVDVAILDEVEAIDWEWISRKAHALGCSRQVALSLRLARDLLGMRMPSVFAHAVEEPVVAQLAREIADETLAPASPIGIWRALRRNLALRKGVRSKLGHAWTSWVSPGLGDWQRWDLPKAAFAVYWMLRPVRLAEKYLLRRTPPAATPRTPPPPPHSTG